MRCIGVSWLGVRLVGVRCRGKVCNPIVEFLYSKKTFRERFQFNKKKHLMYEFGISILINSIDFS